MIGRRRDLGGRGEEEAGPVRGRPREGFRSARAAEGRERKKTGETLDLIWGKLERLGNGEASRQKRKGRHVISEAFLPQHHTHQTCLAVSPLPSLKKAREDL